VVPPPRLGPLSTLLLTGGFEDLAACPGSWWAGDGSSTIWLPNRGTYGYHASSHMDEAAPKVLSPELIADELFRLNVEFKPLVEHVQETFGVTMLPVYAVVPYWS
jgi:hypothetical protein